MAALATIAKLILTWESGVAIRESVERIRYYDQLHDYAIIKIGNAFII